jgi:hypothetical protein
MKRSLIAFRAFAGLAGCAAGSEGEVKLGVDVAAITAAAGTDAQTGSALVLGRVRVLVADAKIGYSGGKSTGSSAEAGPYVIDLTADEIASGAHREFSLGTLESGTYGGAEIEIQPIASDDGADDAVFDDFHSTGASVLVDGTYQGKSFQFAGHFLAEQGTDGEVTIDASSPVTLAMTVDPSGWFLDASGAALDPSDAAQHDALAVAVCETLDTQPQAAPAADSGAKSDKAGHGSPGGGGQVAHCVEQTAK